MTRYSQASKAVGWKEPDVPIKFPTIERVLALAGRIEAGDWDAFVDLFRIYRFAPSPLDEAEAQVMHLVVALHTKGREIFEREETP